jgi:probable HAF family extracellular repeat protein
MSSLATPARLAAALACSAALAAHAARPLYHVEAYDPQVTNDSLTAISANGIAAGQATFPTTKPGESDAVTFANGRYRLVDPNPGDYEGASVFGVNSAGTTVGWAWPDPDGEAVTWDAAGRMTHLPGGATDVQGINDAGQVIGTTQNQQATIWDADGTPTLLAPLGSPTTKGYAVNASGWATGAIWVASDTSHPFLYKDGRLTDLGTLGLHGMGYAINDLGEVAGVAYFGPTWASAHPVWWDGTNWHDLVGLGGKGASAQGINHQGTIVGWSKLKNKPRSAAFVYTGGKMYQLDKCLDAATAPGWRLSSANAINDAGVIVGVGYFDGAQHGFVATPVAE